jgi:predicted permease
MNPFHLLRRKSDLTEELNSHLNLAIADRISRGESPEAARTNALREFGNLPLVADVTRERRGWLRFERLLQDLRYALRTLARDRGFTIVAVLILALGIGANIVVFSVVNTILLRPLPFHDAQQLVWFAGNHGIGGISDTTYKVDSFEAYRQHNKSFQNITAYLPFLTISEGKLTGFGDPKSVQGLWAAGDFFQTLGVQPYIGRQFSQNESVNYDSGGNPAVILSYGFWKQQFHSDPQLIGKSITISNRSYPVVGVLPASFDFGSVFAPGVKVDFFIPISMNSLKDAGHALALVGRLKPGISGAQAQLEANILFPQLRDSLHLEGVTDYQTVITGLKDHVSGQLRRSLIVLWCAVGLILLIVCVNLSNLFLARAAARTKEFALRVALGASLVRLVRQLLTESLVLSTAGAVLGLGFAYAAIQYLAHQGSITLPLLSTVRIDATALAWTLLLAIAVGLLFGIAPGLKIVAGNLQDSLKDSGPSASGGKKHERMRSTLVISEIALACVLLVGAGLLLRSFLQVMDVDLGFQPANASAIKVDYNDSGSALKRSAVLQEMLRRITAIPGIESAGITDNLPLEHSRSWDLYGKGVSHSPGSNQGAFVQIVTPDYLRAMGMTLVEGRDFNWNDTPTSPPVIIINQAAAKREWPGQDPIGKLAINFGSDNHDVQVVGVVANVHESSVEENPGPEIYVPITQADPEGVNLVIRSALPLGVLSPSVVSTLRSMNPGQPAAEFRPIQTIVDHSTSPRRFFATLVALFAVLGLILASLGIYGVISYSVTQQTQEIGIRMALGATRERVQMSVITKTLRMALIGVAVGTVASFAVARAISSMLFGTAPTDPVTFTVMALLLTAVALAAAYIPARRASQTNPITALRSN